jgi:light-regulated signal transduction histidine kinase (bacteriophytochrome)
MFYIESLTKIYPTAKKFTDVASGLLALSISKAQRDYILWFRPEVIQTVNWEVIPMSRLKLNKMEFCVYRRAIPLSCGKRQYD